MAYLEPNGTIEIFENISLDNSYNNSLWFDSISDQTNYFNSQSKRTYPRCYYTRKNRGFIRVKDKADTLYRYNYMRYKNASHTNKWIYCFILSVDYINENTTQINYEVDLIQTYMFDIVIRDSFVDRQHSLTDEIGDNLIEENLKIGDNYIVEGHDTLVDLTPDRILFVIAKQIEYTGGIYHVMAPAFSVINGVGTKTTIAATKIPTSQQEASTLSIGLGAYFANINDNDIVEIVTYNSKLDGLANISISQSNLFGGNFFSYPTTIVTNDSYRENINTSISMKSDFDGYVPKNKKLFSYPYKFFSVLGADKDTQDYKYELFMKENNSRPINFLLEGALFPYPQYILAPKNYQTVPKSGSHIPIGEMSVAYASSVAITDVVNVPYATDTFKGYLLQTQGSRTYAIARTLASVGMAIASFGATSIASGAGAIAGSTGAIGTSLIPYAGTAIGQPLHRAMGDELPSTKVGSIFREANFPPEQKLQYESPSATNYSYGRKANPYPAIGSLLSGAANARGLANGVNGGLNSDGIKVGSHRLRFEYFCYCIKPEYAKIIDEYFTMYGYKMNSLMGVISPSSTNNESKNKRRKYWNYTKTVGCNVEKSVTTIGCTSDEMTGIAEIYDKGITFWQPYHVIGDYTGDNSPRA